MEDYEIINYYSFISILTKRYYNTDRALIHGAEQLSMKSFLKIPA